MDGKQAIYEMYTPSWESLKQMTEHLPRVAGLGVDIVWLTPPYLSGDADGGYDVANYYAIDPRLSSDGTYDRALKEFSEFVSTAHRLGLEVILDLPINHTSVKHSWFQKNPEFYCWTDHPEGAACQNLFDGGSIWEQAENSESYLHLFTEEQADLCWFHEDGTINEKLLDEFRGIVRFWMKSYGVDGFRIDYPQGINKNWGDLNATTPEQLASGESAIEVVEAIFGGYDGLTGKRPLVLVELWDTTDGDILARWAQSNRVDFILDVVRKNTIVERIEEMRKSPRTDSEIYCDSLQALASELAECAKIPKLALDLESHDVPRFPSRTGLAPEDILTELFRAGLSAVCLYQGQELGLANPTEAELPDERMLELDAEAKMRFERGESLKALRLGSRANARLPLPMGEYAYQMGAADSMWVRTHDATLEWQQNS